MVWLRISALRPIRCTVFWRSSYLKFSLLKSLNRYPAFTHPRPNTTNCFFLASLCFHWTFHTWWDGHWPPFPVKIELIAKSPNVINCFLWTTLPASLVVWKIETHNQCSPLHWCQTKLCCNSVRREKNWRNCDAGRFLDVCVCVVDGEWMMIETGGARDKRRRSAHFTCHNSGKTIEMGVGAWEIDKELSLCVHRFGDTCAWKTVRGSDNSGCNSK